MRPHLFMFNHEMVQWLYNNYMTLDPDGGHNPNPSEESRRKVAVWSMRDTDVVIEVEKHLHEYSEMTGITYDALDDLAVMRYGESDGYAVHSDLSFNDEEVRKISFIVQLSSPSEYVGGSVVIHDDGKRFAMPQKQGAGMMFPSWLWHEVTPVESGTRLSLVCWATGEPWS